MAKKTNTDLVDLPKRVVRAFARPRAGFEAHVALLLDVYRKNIGELKIPKLAPAKIASEAKLSASYDKPIAAAAKKLEVLKETKLKHASASWTGFCEIYSKAKLASKGNDDIAAALEPVVSFMALGPRTPKTPPPAAK